MSTSAPRSESVEDKILRGRVFSARRLGFITESFDDGHTQLGGKLVGFGVQSVHAFNGVDDMALHVVPGRSRSSRGRRRQRLKVEDEIMKRKAVVARSAHTIRATTVHFTPLKRFTAPTPMIG